MISGIRKIEMNANVLSDLSGSKPAKVSDNVITGMRKYYGTTTNPLNKGAYRSRVHRLYNKLAGIKPLDNIINDVIYTGKYVEKGLVLEQSINTIKQGWIEFRLIYNEIHKNNVVVKHKKETIKPLNKNDSYILANFDSLFDKLTKDVDGVDKHVNELKERRKNLHTSTEILEKNKKDLDVSRTQFDKYIDTERKKLEDERKAFEKERKESLKEIERKNVELNKRFSKLQILTEQINKKLSDISN